MTIKAIQAAIDAIVDIEDAKIAVVDNASTDNSADILREKIVSETQNGKEGWGKVSLSISTNNGGFGAGNNIAIRKYLSGKEAAEFFYIQNSDAFPEKDAIARLINHMESNPQTGIAGSYIYGVDGVPHTTSFRFPSILGELEGAIKFGPITRLLKNFVVPLGIPNKTRQVDWLAGASMMIRRSALEQTGLFDEKFFLYYEETDLCRRAKKLGWNTDYVIESAVCHVGSASTGMKVVSRMPQYWFDSRRYYFIKNHGHVYYLAVTFFRVLGEVGHRIRAKLEGKRHNEPEKFISDMIAHVFSAKK